MKLSCIFLAILCQTAIALLSPNIVEIIRGDAEDDCGIYPRCRQFGEGTHEILENCNRYFNCTLQPDGTYLQYNLQCPDDLAFTEEYGSCLPFDQALKCTYFHDTKCFAQCPRVYLEYVRPALEHQERSLGCFRLKGSKIGNSMPYYQNINSQYLTPDAYSSICLLYTSPSPRDKRQSRMPSSA